MKKFATMNVIILILTLSVSIELSSAATMRYYANFDDGKVATPSTGYMGVVNQFGEYPAPTDQYTFQPGRSGLALTDKTTMYGGNSGNIANSLYWDYYSFWPTDEIYISWWERHQEPYSNINLNIKLMYLFFDPNDDVSRNRASMERAHDQVSQYGARGAYLDKNGNYFEESGWWAQLTNMTDGNWHHFELYINFKGYTTKLWWDSVLKLNKTYDPSQINWNRRINWLFIGGPFTPGIPVLYGRFTRQIDDVEIWDGMPGMDRSILPILPPNPTLIPRPPVNLNIK